jgi:hypothetical protein
MTPKQFAALYKKHGSIRAVALAGGIPYHAAHKVSLTARAEGLVEVKTDSPDKETRKSQPGGKALETSAIVKPLPKPGKIKRYILTCAQNDTKLHESTWNNIIALAEHYDAELHVSRFYYVKKGLGATNDKDSITRKSKPELYGQAVSWDPKTQPYWSDDMIELAPGLVWVGLMNVLPTAVRPLSGLEVFTGRKSGIFPHVKIAMQSVPSMKHEPTKFNYTTGTITQRNYIQRKAGIKAEFHHCYGALLVEVDSDGNWFCRQLNADNSGTIHDLNIRVRAGVVDESEGRVEAITWGDIHVAQMADMVKELAWGEGGMLDVLHPRYQFMHDLFDFKSRNHHDRRNHHAMYEKYQHGIDSVDEELQHTASFLDGLAHRDWCETVVVESNHDNALERWLRDDPGWYARDPVNAEIFLELQLRKYQSIGKWDGSDDRFLLIEFALKRFGGLTSKYKFLHEDESFVICHDHGGGIECGLHGHNGPNGSRGGINAFVKTGRKKNIGHSHTAGIHDGVYQSGVSGELDMGYNVGPSSWSHSHTVTYSNGKRAIVTMWNGKWRA